MAANSSDHTILFADITGSTKLYDSLGDQEARKLCAASITQLTSIVSEHNGRVIKTMGDGLMASFAAVQDAYNGSVAMQESHIEKQLSITVGFHCGLVIEEEGDLFGDAVNIAAKIAEKAKPGEILLTEQTVTKLPGICRMTTRLLDATRVKGKSDLIKIYTLLYDQAEATMYVSRSPHTNTSAPPTSLNIICGDQNFSLSSSQAKTFQLGRDRSNNLISNSPYASRIHALIEFQRDHFVITDQSTNGTYVNSNGENTFYLKRESAPLIGEGIISLGQKPLTHDPALLNNRFFIYYSNKY